MSLAALLLAATQSAAETAPPEPAVHARLLTGSVSSDDYPRAAIRAREQGTTIIRFTVHPDGRASDCRLFQSSGSERLDGTACGLATRRFRYTPAEDAAGRRVAEWLVFRIEWILPGNIRVSTPIPYSETEPAQ